MNTKYSKLTLVALVFGAVLFMSYRGGSPGGRSGSSTDGSTCGTSGGCHGNVATQIIPQDMISSDIPETGYAAGATYNISVSPAVEGIAVWGFEMMAENASGDGVGTFANNADVNTKDNGLRATHKSASTSGKSGKTWTVEWTAPATGTGEVKFYAAALAANGNGNTSGDDVVIDTLTIAENATASVNKLAAIAIAVYPNPTSDLLYITGYSNTNAVLSVFDILGAEILRKPFARSIDVSALPSGAYYLKIVNGDIAVSKKFVVQ